MLRILILLLIAPAASAQAPKSYPVPYKLSNTQHIVVRVKINGQGPLNMVIDTGCPVLLISKEGAKKVGLDPKQLLVKLEKLDFEGGLSMDQVPAVLSTPFQIEGMNAMGLPGVELHGLMGASVIAKVRMEIDLTRDRMIWTPTGFEPKQPKTGGKSGSTGLEMVGTLMKVMSVFAGIKPAPPPVPRGFWGMQLEERDGKLQVSSVLPKGPAESAGIQAGDVVTEIEGKKMQSLADFQARTARQVSGFTVRVQIQRAGESKALKMVLGEGL